MGIKRADVEALENYQGSCQFCFPEDPLETIIGIFRRSEKCCIAVLSDAHTRTVLGIITWERFCEQYIMCENSSHKTAKEFMLKEVSVATPYCSMSTAERWANIAGHPIPRVNSRGEFLGFVENDPSYRPYKLEADFMFGGVENPYRE